MVIDHRPRPSPHNVQSQVIGGALRVRSARSTQNCSDRRAVFFLISTLHTYIVQGHPLALRRRPNFSSSPPLT